MPETEASSFDPVAWGRIGAHESWARTVDRSARTAPARQALEEKFLQQAGGDPLRAEHLRRAHFQRLAQKSVATRKAKAAAKRETGSAPRLATKRGTTRLLDPTGEKAARNVDHERESGGPGAAA